MTTSPFSRDQARNQRNALLRQPMGMSPTEANIFAWALSHLSHYHPDPYNDAPHPIGGKMTFFHIKLSNVSPYSPGGYNFELVRQACIDLFQKSVNLLPSNAHARDLYLCRIFCSIRIDYGKFGITGEFAPDILPSLYALFDSDYPPVNVQTLMQLKSQYAYRLYWFLCPYESEVMSFELEKIRAHIFAAPDSAMYPLFFDFKRFVLEPTLKELNELKWMVTYTEIKQGRKVVALEFHLPRLPTTPLDLNR